MKPTPITAEDYIYYQVNKHAKKDPLDAILDHIRKNPLHLQTKLYQIKGVTLKNAV